MNQKFKQQDEQYTFPYHYLVSFGKMRVGKAMDSGVEYYCYMSKALSLVERQHYNSLLDVGCGEGRMISLLAPKYPDKKYTGVDLSERGIMLAKALNYGVPNVDFSVTDVTKMQKEYDVITCIETLEHIPNEYISDFTAALFARLRKGGALIISVPSVRIPLQSKHYRHYTQALLEEHLSKFQLDSVYFVMRGGLLRDLSVRLARKFSTVVLVQRLVYWFAKNLVFTASEDDGRHIVAVFKKV